MTGALFVLWAVVFFGPFVAWALFRSPGYKRQPLDRPPTGPGWHPTAERFRDPVTDQPIQIWYNGTSGERAYVRVADRGERAGQ